MDAFPGGMMPHMASGIMMPPGMMGMDLPFPGPGMDARNRMWPNEMGFQGAGPGSGIHPNSREGSVFYKTRICNRFAEGNCSYGDRCNYAHGEAELRTLPPEGQKLLEGKAKMEAARMVPSMTSPSEAPKDLPRRDAGGMQERSGVRTTAFKSRLCTRFMQKGDCSYGPNCHFAHGQDDLQNAGRPDMSSAEGAGFDMPFHGGGLMMPGGPMMPPDFMAMAMGGRGGNPMAPHRPRPPPGPPPPDSALSDKLASPERDDFVFDITRTPTRTPSDVPYLDRVRAMCAVMGVGVLKVKDAGHEAVEAAISSLQTGEAVQSNAYADGLDVRI